MKRHVGLLAVALLSSCFLNNQNFAAESRSAARSEAEGIIEDTRIIFDSSDQRMPDGLLESISRRAALRELVLFSQGIDGQQVAILAEQLRALPFNALEEQLEKAALGGECPESGIISTKLERLCLAANIFGDGGLQFFAERALSRMCCWRLRVLDLSYNEFGDKGLRHLAHILSIGNCPQLRELYLNDNDHVGTDGMIDLAKALPALSKLEKLWINDTRTTRDGVEVLARSLKNGACPQLREINTRGIRVSRRDVRTLFRGIKKSCPHLKQASDSDSFSDEEESTKDSMDK